MVGSRIIVGPLDEVIGQIESAVVVRTILEIDYDDAGVSVGVGVLPQQDVTSLQIVVTENHGAVDCYQMIPNETNRNKYMK